MHVGIQKTFFKGYFPYIQRFEKILDHNGIKHTRMECDDPEFFARVRDLDLFIFWWRHDNGDWRLASALIPVLEKYVKVNCLPNVNTCWAYDDKIREYYLLRQNGYPMAESWIFWSREKALKWAQTAALPVVFKLSGGAGSENVTLVKTRDRALKLVERMFGDGIQSTKIPWGSTKWIDFRLKRDMRHWAATRIRKMQGVPLPALDMHKNYVYFQKFLPNNDFDTRITVIGDRAFGYRRYTRTGDFRASGSGKLDLDPKRIDEKFLRMAFEISKKLGFQSMAYDFLYEEDKSAAICEVSYNFIDQYIYNCPGHWDSNLGWHEGHRWPQLCQLMDALKRPDLKQPDAETMKI